MDDMSKYKNAQERQMKNVCHPPPPDETWHSGSVSVLTVGPGVPLRIFIMSQRWFGCLFLLLLSGCIIQLSLHH